jgi:antitoxin ParD1/3/4
MEGRPRRYPLVGFYATEREMPNAEKISVTITPDMLRVIRESIEAGEYASASEVLRDAMRVWQRQRIEDAERIEAIRARVRRSLEDPRPSLSEEEVEARLQALFAETAKTRGDAAA